MVREVMSCGVHYSFKVDETVYGYLPTGGEPEEGDEYKFFLKDEINGEYERELLFGVILAVLYIAAAVIFEIVSVLFVEIKWKKLFTFIKTSQLPKPLSYRSSDDSEPFIVKNANYDKFGRMTMKTGCLVCPKFLDNENVKKRFHLTSDVMNYHIKERSGFWNVLAASAKHEKEKIVYRIKIPFKKLVFSRRGLFTTLTLPITMVGIIFVLFLILYAFFIFEGPSLGLSAICVILSIIMLYFIGAIFEFIAGLIQLFSEEIVFTNTRIVFSWIERFNNKIEYIFFDDLDAISLTDKNVVCKVKRELVDRLRDLLPKSVGDTTHFSHPLTDYLKYLPSEKVSEIMNLLKELKEKYPTIVNELDDIEKEEEELEVKQDDIELDTQPEIKISLDDEKIDEDAIITQRLTSPKNEEVEINV